MFRLHKTKPAAKSGERIDFKFSQFKVHQVPKGWDKLFVSVISVETGKTIAKTSKAAVKNGNCQWIDTVSESIWIASQDGQSSKELEDCPYKLLVAMGSARSGMLGEAILNMATYMNSSDSVPVSFPLKKCNHGTILQLKIQCVTPRTNIRDAESKGTNSSKEDIDADSKNSEIKSEESDNSIAKGSRSYSSRDLGSLTHQGDQGRQGGGEAVQDTSFPVSDSHHSYNSEEISLEREEHNLTAGQESTSSKDSVPPRSSNADNASQSSHSSFNSRITHSDNLSQDEPQEFAALSLKISDSSKSLLEAAEDTIEELRGEAKMWERNARKLMLDLELVRKEYSEQSKNQLNLAIELSAACAERDGLQKEVEQLKLLLEKTMKKPSGLEDLELQDTGVNRIIKELENEIKYQKESNANLTLQLNRSQESNAELVSVLQELEATVEKQKAEIKNDQAAEKNQDLVLQMQQLQESEKFLQAKVQELEKVLENKNQNLENASLSDQILVDIETEYESKLSAKEKETVSLKAKLSDTQKQRHCLAESKSADEAVGNLMEEIESLKAKLQELESDCQELTEENLELLVRLKEMKKNSAEEGVSLTATRFEVSDNDPEEKVREKVLKEIETDHNLSIQELENLKLHLEHKVNELSRELSEKGEVIERLDAGLLSKEEQIENLHRYQRELEEKFSSLQKEKSQLEENMEIVSGESDIAMKCMNALQKDLTVLSSSVNNHVSANKVLERKTSEIESSKRELEIHLSELEQENEELSACIAVMEAQIRNLTDDRESIELELENSKSNAVIIQDEIARLRNETETQKRDAKQKLEEMKNRWSEAEEELEHLRSANPKLQATAESLMEECSLLQKSNGELKMRKLELEGQCNHLETKLRESHRSFSDCSKRVSVLQESICSLLEQSASKERSLSSELDALLKENEKQNKKLSVVNEMYMEKMVLVENLQQEIGDLTKKLSATQNERERITSDAANEVSKLRENVAKVESELNTVNIEFKIKIQGLTNELASSKESQEMLKADNGKMLKLLENYRSREENFKTTLNGLELNLTVSEYERQQLMEECKNLKAQLQKIESLEDEVLALKNELKAIKSEKEKLGTSLRLKSEECEELKTEKILCIDKITELQKEVSELEDCKQDKFALQEKLQQLESDLIAKEALCEQDAELKNQLNRIKRTNKQLQQQHQQLEEEKQKCRTRAQSLEEELIMMKDKQRSLRESRSVNSISNQHQRELLEDEVSKSVEVNNGYKPQVKRLTSEGRKGWTGSPRKSKAEGEFVPKEKFERTKSSLEAELRDIRERYFHMSLKYAEVEEEREELVMKLKAANSGKGWF
ncbi:myosin-11 isoform X2 [Ricinus communis]|uniref:myosin-11 isoform X2 n=1 Tax=Ricinus communis TaxID=3988 RepID=UPI00201A3230|nr:myosin-11 isoform X2 [Ricinus communis]